MNAAPKRPDIEGALLDQIRAAGLPEPAREVAGITPGRRWVFDFGWERERLLLECQGGIHSRGAHVRGPQYESDCEKAAQATVRGWRCLAFTAGMIADGRAIALLTAALLGTPPPQSLPPAKRRGRATRSRVDCPPPAPASDRTAPASSE